MLGLDFDTVRVWALVVVVVVVVLAVAAAWIIKMIIGKVVSIVVLGALAALVWSQRESLQDCADRVGSTLEAGAVDDATCTFFGREVTVRSPLGD